MDNLVVLDPSVRPRFARQNEAVSTLYDHNPDTGVVGSGIILGSIVLEQVMNPG